MREFVIVETIPVKGGSTQEAAMRFSAILAVDKGIKSEVVACEKGRSHLCVAEDDNAVWFFTPGCAAKLDDTDDDDSGCDCGENCDRSPGDPCLLEEEKTLPFDPLNNPGNTGGFYWAGEIHG